MNDVSRLCDNCGGHGTIEVRNAYDLKAVEQEICDICLGTGIADDDNDPRFVRTKKKSERDHREFD